MSEAHIESREKQLAQQEGTRAGWTFRPDVDIVESGDAYVVTADLPGANETSVRIGLEDGVLTIDAHTANGPDPAWRPLYAEYRPGNYHRQFQLSEEIDAGRIEAKMRDGVLTLSLPKSEAARPRQIRVTAE